MDDEWVSPRQVGDELDVSARTVQRWIRDGRLEARRVGGRFRVSRSSLRAVAGAGGDVVASRPALHALLIANRGEIAARIARTAAALGLRTIAVHEPDDPPVAAVDLAIEVSSYLDGTAIVAAAQGAGADAVHPGYGFLAENPAFAADVVSAGLAWVGPPPDAIAAMGDKAAARRMAAGLGVPVLPGYDGPQQGDDVLRREARRIGLPLLVKPAAGGGGKGMRVVRHEAHLPDALAAARGEAGRAFGDERLILERLLEGARHVEIQVLFDGRGDGVHLGERDCSAQRRNQKIVEEAPAPRVDEGLRERMGAAALRIGREVGYRNAGTVEFLLASDGSFYFLEMNTRLQVEHPVTEAVTGRDLVADQLRVAAGEPLGLAQDAVRLDGHAIEVRLYAEDPDALFLPASGRLLRVRWPAEVRVDGGVREGMPITGRYDPLLAKLIASGPTRDEALARLRTALDETRILGVRTNLRFLRWLLAQPVFAHGRVRTDTIAALQLPDPPAPSEDAWRSAAAAAREAGLLPGGAWGGGWRLNAPAAVRLRHAGEVRRVELSADGPMPPAVADAEAGTVHVDVEGQSLDFEVVPPPSVEEAALHAATHGEEAAVLIAPMPGRVLALRAVEGERVEAHQAVVVLEAMKMEHAVLSPLAGTVARLAVVEGQQVRRGEVLAEVSA